MVTLRLDDVSWGRQLLCYTPRATHITRMECDSVAVLPLQAGLQLALCTARLLTSLSWLRVRCHKMQTPALPVRL